MKKQAMLSSVLSVAYLVKTECWAAPLTSGVCALRTAGLHGDEVEHAMVGGRIPACATCLWSYTCAQPSVSRRHEELGWGTLRATLWTVMLKRDRCVMQAS